MHQNEPFSMFQQEEYFYPESDAIRPTDVLTSPTLNNLLLAAWLVLCGIGVYVAVGMNMPLVGGLIAGLPTFFGMIFKPTFGLCLMAMVMSTGAGVSYEGLFALDKGIGLALGISFFLNITVTRPHLSLRPAFIRILVVYSLWVCATSLLSPDRRYEITHTILTQIQLLVFSLIAYWILESNGFRSLIWVLRSYVIGVVGSSLLTFITGAAMSSVSEDVEGRLGATLGTSINANLLGIFIGLAFVTSIYLVLRDTSLFWRLIIFVMGLLCPLLIFKTGSRTVAVATIGTLFVPLLFVKQLASRPRMMIGIFLLFCLIGVGSLFLMSRSNVEESVSKRLGDIQHAKEALQYRMTLNKAAVKTAVRRPWGTGYASWFALSGMEHWPHNNVFYTLGLYGFPGLLLLSSFWVCAILKINKIPYFYEKLYTVALFTFIFTVGLAGSHILKKFFWLFLIVIFATEAVTSRMRLSEIGLWYSTLYPTDNISESEPENPPSAGVE